MQPDLSVIVVNWNTHDLLVGCLESIAQTRDDLNVEIIVVDNASDDGSRAMIRQRCPNVRLIFNQENVGFARANNQALAFGQGRYALLLNSDTIVLPRSLATLLATVDVQTDAGIIEDKVTSEINVSNEIGFMNKNMLQPRWKHCPRVIGAVYTAQRLSTVAGRSVHTTQGAPG